LPCRRRTLSTEQELNDFLKAVERRAFKRTVYAVRDEDAALDIVQDAMIRLAEKYADRPADEWPLLFQRILSNATLDWFRRQKVRNAVLTSVEDLESGDEDASIDLLEYLESDDESTGTESAADAAYRSHTESDRRRDKKIAGTSTGSLPDALLGGHGRR